MSSLALMPTWPFFPSLTQGVPGPWWKGTTSAPTAPALRPRRYQPQGGDGIEIASDNNTIGGMAPGAGNVISGNGCERRVVLGARRVSTSSAAYHRQRDPGQSHRHRRQRDAARTQWGRDRLRLHSFSPTGSTTIGGSTPGAGNTIAFNNGPGVWVTGDPTNLPPDYSTGVRIEGNSIYDNAGLGIDLGGVPIQYPNDIPYLNGSAMKRTPAPERPQ